jgi:hypothetical protein
LQSCRTLRSASPDHLQEETKSISRLGHDENLRDEREHLSAGRVFSLFYISCSPSINYADYCFGYGDYPD